MSPKLPDPHFGAAERRRGGKAAKFRANAEKQVFDGRTPIRLCVPVIYEDNYIDSVIDYNDRYSDEGCFIYEVYGSMRTDIIGNLRPSFSIKEINIVKLQEYINILHTHNVRFDYVINSTLSPMPIEPCVKPNEFLTFIRGLVELGVDSFTVTNAYFVMLLKHHFPFVKINASICNEVSSIHQVRELEEMGVDCFILDRDINRRFHLLNRIRESTKKDLKLLCNSPCLYQCVNVQYHANHSSFLSVSPFCNIIDKTRAIPFCRYYCLHRYFSMPAEHIKAQWIRPEDLKYYRDIGISLFKLDGRDKTTDYMLGVLKSYLCQRYDGNFFHLLHNRYTKNMKDIKEESTNQDALLKEWKIGIDNRELDGFIDLFQKNGCEGVCEECSICEIIARNIIVNKDWQKQACQDLENRMKSQLLL